MLLCQIFGSLNYLNISQCLLYLCLLLSCRGFSSEWTVEADAIYWKAGEAGLSYVVKTHGVEDSSLKNPHFEWDFGFKLGIGHLLSNNWDILLRLTHLHTHTDSMLHAKESATLYPIWITQGHQRFADEIKMHWRLHLALVDALLEKCLKPDAHLILMPQGGLRYAIVRQKFNLEYHGGAFSIDEEEYVRMKNKFWGLGPYGALGLQWHFAKHFCLCATGGLGAVYGEFYIHEDEDLFQEHVKIFGLRDSWWQIALLSEAQILLRFQKTWEKAKKKLEIQVGWNNLLLFKQNRLARFFETASSLNQQPGDLSLHGWEWGFRFTF